MRGRRGGIGLSSCFGAHTVATAVPAGCGSWQYTPVAHLTTQVFRQVTPGHTAKLGGTLVVWIWRGGALSNESKKGNPQRTAHVLALPPKRPLARGRSHFVCPHALAVLMWSQSIPNTTQYISPGLIWGPTRQGGP